MKNDDHEYLRFHLFWEWEYVRRDPQFINGEEYLKYFKAIEKRTRDNNPGFSLYESADEIIEDIIQGSFSYKYHPAQVPWSTHATKAKLLINKKTYLMRNLHHTAKKRKTKTNYSFLK